MLSKERTAIAKTLSQPSSKVIAISRGPTEPVCNPRRGHKPKAEPCSDMTPKSVRRAIVNAEFRLPYRMIAKQAPPSDARPCHLDRRQVSCKQVALAP
jgi:hypothetical protein